MNLALFLGGCAIFCMCILQTSAGPPLQMEIEEPLFPDVVSARPRYIMPDYHLPKQFKPSHYTLRLRPIFEDGPDQFKVPGSVTILADCINNSTNITLHINGVDIDHESVKIQDVASNTEISRRDYSTDEENQIYIIHTDSPLLQGRQYSISITFNATAGGTSQVLGMYHRSYTKPGGQIKNLILTKLEAVGARMIFPCFDEPALKATFDVSIAHTMEYNTLCNMPKNQENISDPSLVGWYWDHYETSVSMSTYLLAIIVSDFTSVDAEDGLYEKPVKTWAAPHHIDNGGGEYGVNDTANMMKYFETLYDLKYPLPKMDSAALPGFSSGAMEQWGLITYREDYLLYFEGETTEIQRRRVSEVIAHELAHQWFGNIVTMEWWDDLWLNEGFATYIEKLGLHQFHPEFQSDNLIVADDMQSSMVRDAQPNSLTVHYDGDNLSAIVYSKAACLIRMMVAFLTESTFQTAINEYLKVHSWGNAVQDDLFEILTAQGHKDGTLASEITVKEIMDTWTRQTGFPLIRVNRVSNNRVYISQERFGHSAPLIDTTVLNDKHLWHVPISYYTEADSDYGQKNQQPKLWLPKTTLLTNHVLDISKWIIVNTDARGYYRVLYDNSLIIPIRAQLLADHKVFSDATRSQLIDDYFKSAFAGYVQITDALELTKYLSKEDKLMVWTSVLNNLRTSFVHLTSNSVYKDSFKNYFYNRIEGGLSLIGQRQTTGERGASVILRSQLLDWACSLKLRACVEYAQELFQQWSITSRNEVPVDLRPMLYCAMVGHINAAFREKSYQFVLQAYKDEETGTAKTQLRNALACAVDRPIISGLLNATSIPPLSDIENKVDGIEIFKRLLGNSDAREIAFQYLKDNFVTILTYHGFAGVANIISGLAPYINEPSKLAELRTFLDENNGALLGAQTSINSTLTTIEDNISWMNNYGQDMGPWFNQTS